jgi:hypothetical protein
VLAVVVIAASTADPHDAVPTSVPFAFRVVVFVVQLQVVFHNEFGFSTVTVTRNDRLLDTVISSPPLIDNRGGDAEVTSTMEAVERSPADAFAVAVTVTRTIDPIGNALGGTAAVIPLAIAVGGSTIALAPLSTENTHVISSTSERSWPHCE